MVVTPQSAGSTLKRFLNTEVGGAAVLFGGAVIALVWANSPWSASYESFWHKTTGIEIGNFELRHDLRHWVNEGLMTLFFLIVTLEIKRELLHGRLRSFRRAALPMVCAIGGMVVPAIIFLSINSFDESVSRGWGIPIATDIAFALGVVALFGSKLPGSLRAFLLTLAIVDDLIAIVVIAIFYTGDISLVPLSGALGAAFFIALGFRTGFRLPVVYLVLGIGLWVLFSESGVHATLAGVSFAMLVPTRAGTSGKSIAERLEDRIHPWTSYLIVPVFALANAGVNLDFSFRDGASSRIVWGVVFGLVVGKFVGITLFALIAVRIRLGSLPSGLGWWHVLGVAATAGVGFTVSLFIAELAFVGGEWQSAAKLGILIGSLVAGGLGALILGLSRTARPAV